MDVTTISASSLFDRFVSDVLFFRNLYLNFMITGSKTVTAQMMQQRKTIIITPSSVLIMLFCNGCRQDIGNDKRGRSKVNDLTYLTFQVAHRFFNQRRFYFSGDCRVRPKRANLSGTLLPVVRPQPRTAPAISIPGILIPNSPVFSIKG